MIARTRVSERVRATLEQMRLQRSQRFTRPEIVESDDEEVMKIIMIFLEKKELSINYCCRRKSVYTEL